MLKRSVLALLAISFALTAAAKGGNVSTEWGVTAGIRYNGISLYDVPSGFSVRPGITYNAGVQAGVIFGMVAVQPELNYGYTTLKVLCPQSDDLPKTSVKCHEIEIPLLLSLHMLDYLRINAGPVFNIMSRTNYYSGEESMMYGNLHPTFGYAAGLTFCISGKFIIDARFTGYLNRTLNEFNPYTPGTSGDAITFRSKSWSGGIKIGYLF